MKTTNAAPVSSLTIAERVDAQGAYFTPIEPTPSGRRTMAATLLTPSGPKTGPRYSTRGACETAITEDARRRAQLEGLT